MIDSTTSSNTSPRTSRTRPALSADDDELGAQWADEDTREFEREAIDVESSLDGPFEPGVEVDLDVPTTDDVRVRYRETNVG